MFMTRWRLDSPSLHSTLTQNVVISGLLTLDSSWGHRSQGWYRLQLGLGAWQGDITRNQPSTVSDCSTDLQGRPIHTFYKLTVSSRTQKLENVQVKVFNSEERLETQKMVEAVITNLEIKDHDGKNKPQSCLSDDSWPCYRGGAGAPGQPATSAADSLLRVDCDEDLWLLPARQGGAHHLRDRGQDKEMREHIH